MAKIKMQKIEIAALLRDMKKIVERLQRRGVVELTDCTDERLVKLNTAASVSQFEKNANTAIAARDILAEYAPTKKSLFSALNGRREIDVDDFGEKISNCDTTLRKCINIVNINKRITENRAAIARTRTLSDQLSMWLPLDIPMMFDGTDSTKFFIGTLPGEFSEQSLLEALAKLIPELDMLTAEIVSSFPEQTCVAVTCHRSVETETYNALRELGFIYPADPTKHPPKVRMERYKKLIADTEKDIEKGIAEIREYAGIDEDIELLIDYLSMRKEKYQIICDLGMTENTFILTGYIPEKYVSRTVKELERKYDAAITVTEVEENEDAPVLIENGGFSSPVESITAMYAMPNKRDVDPTPVMAFFYYVFFGLMLSDAGYGLLMTVAMAVVLWKFKLEDSMKKTCKMFLYCGISTTFWGALFGSWFGDAVQVICGEFFGIELGSIALWFEPIDDPIKLLLYSFLFGILHLYLGLAVNFKMLWSEGKKWDAIFDVIPVYLMVTGVAPFCASILTEVPGILITVGGYMAAVGVLLIIITAGRGSKNIFMRLFGGLYGLYNIASGYLSDILSYSRLLALGLATGSIASVVNMMGTMPENIALKAVVFIIVFIVGHTLNMAINLLGAYVHTIRLQFVELFSKFYEGGGREFSPFRVNTKYIKFKEEILDE